MSKILPLALAAIASGAALALAVGQLEANNASIIASAETNGPILQGPILQGPILQGPILQGPVLNGAQTQGSEMIKVSAITLPNGARIVVR